MNDFSGEQGASEVPAELDIQFGEITRIFTGEDTTVMLFPEDRFNHCVYTTPDGLRIAFTPLGETLDELVRRGFPVTFDEQPDAATMEHYYTVQAAHLDDEEL
jgi:hypothetical protein